MMSFYITVFVAACIYCVHGQSSCNTPDGSEGECKSILECESLLALFQNKDKTPHQSDMLKRSHCGFEDGSPKVCCPSQCRTPEGIPGNCVNIESCYHLADMLKPPVQKTNRQYVDRSRCEGPGHHNVCCGPPPVSSEIDCAETVSAFPPDPKSECCGVDGYAGNRITGGKDTSLDQYPWLALIEYIQGSEVFISCGGSLISGKYVLTAAHCVTGRLVHGPARNIRLGEYDTSHAGNDSVEVEPGFRDYNEGTTVIPIETIITHPGYSVAFRLTTSRHDIALIRMAETVPFTDFIRPICLPSTELNIPKSEQLYAAGWGAVSSNVRSSAIKQHVALPHVDLQKCQSVYNAPWRYAELWAGQICAGGEPGKDSCKGDSGGPLMYHNNGVTELVGVVSFGLDKCGAEGIPAVYTKVFKYIGWIRRNIMP